MIVQFKLDIKTVKKVFAMLDADIPPDDEIIKTMEGGVVDLTTEDDEDIKQAVFGFTMLAVGKLFDEETKK